MLRAICQAVIKLSPFERARKCERPKSRNDRPGGLTPRPPDPLGLATLAVLPAPPDGSASLVTRSRFCGSTLAKATVFCNAKHYGVLRTPVGKPRVSPTPHPTMKCVFAS